MTLIDVLNGLSAFVAWGLLAIIAAQVALAVSRRREKERDVKEGMNSLLNGWRGLVALWPDQRSVTVWTRLRLAHNFAETVEGREPEPTPAQREKCSESIRELDRALRLLDRLPLSALEWWEANAQNRSRLGTNGMTVELALEILEAHAARGEQPRPSSTSGVDEPFVLIPAAPVREPGPGGGKTQL